MTELRSAVLGAGMIGAVHARAINAAGGRVSLVVDREAGNAREAARLARAERWSTSLEDAVGPDIDIVHICLPNHLHAPVARAAIAAGKHVVCEKPLATDVDDAGELARAARTQGVVTAVPFGYRFSPGVREARARIQHGDLGDLRILHGHYLQDWLLEPSAYNWRVDAELGGPSRAFADIGSHLADMIEFVSGHRIVELVALMQTLQPTRLASGSRKAFAAAAGDGTPVAVTTEDTASVLFRTDRGASGSMLVSQASPGRKNRLWFELDGADASVIYDLEDSERLQIGTPDGVLTLPRDPKTASSGSVRYTTLPAGHPQGLHDWFEALVVDVHATIRGEAVDGLPTFEDGLRAAVVTDAVLRSAQTRQWVTVDAS